MTDLEIGLGLDALKKHLSWGALEAFIENIVKRENDMTMTAEEGLPTEQAKARWKLAITLLPDINDSIQSALFELEENKQKGEHNG